MVVELDPCWPTAHDEIEILIENLQDCCEGEGGGGGGPLHIAQSPTVILSGTGEIATPLRADVLISDTPSNALGVLAGDHAGLYVDPGMLGAGVTQEQVQDWVGAGMSEADGLFYNDGANKFGVQISRDNNNALLQKANGVFASLRDTETYANLVTKQSAGTLVAGRWYLISDTKTIGGATGVYVAILAIANNRMSSKALMLHPNFPDTAWPTIYDFDADTLIEVRDHRGNIVQGAQAIADFPFHVLLYTSVTVRSKTAAVFTWSTLATIDNVEFDNPASINLTGYSGIIRDSYFGPGATLVLSGGEGEVGGGPGGTPGLHVDGVLLKDSNNNRFVIRGANLEMYRDYFGGCGWASDGFYDERVVMTDKIVALGINFIRINYTGTTLAGGGRLTKFLDVCEELASRGIYVMPSDHEFTGESLATASSSYAMMGSIIDGFIARDIIDYLVMNPWNEPGPGITASAWKTAQQGVLTYLRTTKGFHGVVVLDGSGWATMLDVTTFQQVMTYDDGLLAGSANVMFSHHLYPNITGLASLIWGAADEVPLLMGEIGQYNETPVTPEYVEDIIAGYISTGRPAGHNGLIAWILNWCDDNKMWEDWTNPSVPYQIDTPLNSYGAIWRDDYYSVMAALYPTDLGGGGDVSSETPLLERIRVVNSTLSATNMMITLTDAIVIDNATLSMNNTDGLWAYFKIESGSAVDLGGSTIGGSFIEAHNSQLAITGITTGAIAAIHVVDSLLNADSINNSTIQNLRLEQSTLDLSYGDNVSCRWNEFIDAFGLCANAVNLTLEHNHCRRGDISGVSGTIQSNDISSGSGIATSGAASTLAITGNTLSSGGTIVATAATSGQIANNVLCHGSINANDAGFVGAVHDCHVASGGVIALVATPHGGDVYFLDVRAGRSVNACADAGFEHRHGIHAGSGSYDYVANASATNVRDQD